MGKEMLTIKVYASLSLVGCRKSNTFKIAAAEWEKMTEAEKDNMCLDLFWEMAEYYWEEME